MYDTDLIADFAFEKKLNGYGVVSGWIVSYEYYEDTQIPVNYKVHYRSSWRLISEVKKNEYFDTRSEAENHALIRMDHEKKILNSALDTLNKNF